MIRIAPVGLLVLIRSATQGLVALAGLRTLGFGTGRPAGACAAVESFSQEPLGMYSRLAYFQLALPLSLLPRAVGDVLHLASFQLAAVKPSSQARRGIYPYRASTQLVDKGAKPL